MGTQQLVQLVSNLTLKISALEERLSHPRRRRSSSSRSFSSYSRRKGRPTRTSGVCYYHNCFGSDAIKFAKPCFFVSQPLNQNGRC